MKTDFLLFLAAFIITSFLIFIFIKKYMVTMPGESYHGDFLPLSAQEKEIRDNLKAIVSELSATIGERNIGKFDNLELAAEYIEAEFKKYGLIVNRQQYQINQKTFSNIIGEKKGIEKPDEILIIGAHYDTVPGNPGADDNASGVAGMLELARILSKKSMAKTIQFIAFVNEEPPFYFSRKMGSWQYAHQASQEKLNIIGMISLESIGYFSDQKGSQLYPFPFGFFYPSQGNFIGFVGNLTSRSLVHQTIGLFRQYTKFPSEGIAAPSFIPGVGWSDQWSFWRHGYPAMMITSTAPFRNPHYHTGGDVANTLNYDAMARIIFGLAFVIEKMTLVAENRCS